MSESCNHNLVLTYLKEPFNCHGCKQLGFGETYSCNKNECNLFFHKECNWKNNDQCLVKHPFSTKCVFKFNQFSPCVKELCDACGKDVIGPHYGCECAFLKRTIHPFCLGYKPTLAVFNGVTMTLMKVASTKCLYCEKKNLRFRVDGWAYVSSCGMYCYHAACVIEIINESWKKTVVKGRCDPLQAIQKRFLDDFNRKNKVVKGRKRAAAKKVVSALSATLNIINGNPLGALTDLKYLFS